MAWVLFSSGLEMNNLYEILWICHLIQKKIQISDVNQTHPLSAPIRVKIPWKRSLFFYLVCALSLPNNKFHSKIFLYFHTYCLLLKCQSLILECCLNAVWMLFEWQCCLNTLWILSEYESLNVLFFSFYSQYSLYALQCNDESILKSYCSVALMKKLMLVIMNRSYGLW